MGEEHGCPYPELSSGDPITPEDFRGSDEGSHYMSTKEGLASLGYDDNSAEGQMENDKKDDEPVPPKQWIILRKDLGMRKGKMVAQGSHGVLKVFLEQMVHGPEPGKFTFYASGPVLAWLEGKFTKVCLGARSEEELVEVYEKARAAGIMCTLITDAGTTEFKGVPTKTCVVIGPAYPEQVNPITGDLPLL